MEKEPVKTSESLEIVEEEEKFIFPSKHYMPKEITQQSEFLQKYPEYDGRGTKIAILDTGIDLSCPGLQKTSTGLPKVLECLDLTGAGDVDTSKVKKVDKKGILTSLTKRKLKIPSTWKNPSGDYHLGTKLLHEIYSSKTLHRISEKKEEEFRNQNKCAIAEAMKELNEHEKKIGSKSKKISDKEDRDEINAKLEYLKEAEKLSIESPILDCIVWNDGEKWKACLDTSFCGDLENVKVMSSFCEDQEYGIISDQCLVSYCLTIHDEGNLLEICLPNGSHGTHVSHIAAGHFPDDPEKDGLAPGAQIISLCIGDSRRGTLLSPQGLIRALNKCIELKVDAINYSYTAVRNCVENGSYEKLIKNVIEKHGIIFVASAGNEGPALASMGFAQGKLHHSVLYIGAYLTAEMKEALYSHHQADSSVVFPFSSRGPCHDGTMGISVSAPGAAITGIPKHNLSNSELMNGTSMASPNAAGNILCLLSAMKAESIPISPFRIKLALMNSAMMPEDGHPHPFSLGAGIIQISSAFEFIKSAMTSIPANLTDIKVYINDKKHGIHLREPREVNRLQEYNVSVVTKFNCEKELEKAVDFECPILLKCSEGSEDFVTFPKYSRLPSSTFSIYVEPMALEAGKVHFTEVIGINSNNPSLGPLFRIPITVIIPEKLPQDDDEYSYKKKLTLEPAIPERIFLQTPNGSSYVKISIKSYEDHKTIKLLLQASNPLFEERRISDNYGFISPKECQTFYFYVTKNQTTEFCITQFWDTLNSSSIKVTFEFYGFSMPYGSQLTMFSTNPTNKIQFTNNLRKMLIYPTVEFKKFCQPLDPTDAIIEPMKDDKRDIIDGKKSFRLLLTYNFNVTTSDEYYSFSPYHDYFQFIDCFFLQLSTKSKKHLYTTAWDRSTKLEKGDYIIRVCFRHCDHEILEKLKDFQIVATQRIKKIYGNLYKDSGSALKGSGSKFYSKSLQSGESGMAFLEAIPAIQYPIQYTAGSYFKGYFCLQNSNYYSSFEVRYMLTAPRSIKKKDSKIEIEADLTENENTVDDSKVEDTVTQSTALKDALRDIEISYITKETDSEKALALFEKLSSEYPKHLPIYSAEIQRLSKLKDLPGMKKVVEKLLEISEYKKVAEFFGVKSEFNEEKLRQKDIMKKKQEAILNALYFQSNLVLDEFLKVTEKDIPDSFRNGFDPKKVEKKKVKSEKENDSKEAGEGEEKTDGVETTASDAEAENKSDSEVEFNKNNFNEVKKDEEKQANNNDEVSSESKNDETLPGSNNEETTSKSEIVETSPESKNEESDTVEEKLVDGKHEVQGNPITSKLEVNIENDKPKIAEDKENVSPTNQKSSIAKSPGGESRTSVNSDDSFEKLGDSGVDSDEISSLKYADSEENSKIVDSVSTAESASSESGTAEPVVETTDSQMNQDSETEKDENESTNNELKSDVQIGKDSEQASENAEPIKTVEESEEIKDTAEQEVKSDKITESILELSDTNTSSKDEYQPEATKTEIEKSETLSTSEATSDVTLEEVEKAFRDYMLFADSTSENAKIVQAKYAVANERFGTALSELKKIISDKTTSSDYLSTEKAIIQLLKKLGWNHLAEEAQKTLLIKHPKLYRLF